MVIQNFDLRTRTNQLNCPVKTFTFKRFNGNEVIVQSSDMRTQSWFTIEGLEGVPYLLTGGAFILQRTVSPRSELVAVAIALPAQ